jgi:Cft2 family RNA processing exonuclease
VRVTLLGCTGGIAADLSTTCLMLDDDILRDAGIGAGDLSMEQMLHIDGVFLTHSHLDHTALLPMLPDMVGPRRDKLLAVYALPETIPILKRDLFNFRLWPDCTALPSPARPCIVFQAVTVGGPWNFQEEGSRHCRYGMPSLACPISLKAQWQVSYSAGIRRTTPPSGMH